MSPVPKEEVVVKPSPPQVQLKGISLGDHEDDDIAAAICNGTVASYSLESALGDCRRSAWVRRRALEMMTGRSLDGFPLDIFDYGSILGQCCELPIGYVKIPVRVARSLLLDGIEYTVPMSTIEGIFVSSTNIGCKAIHMSSGATNVLLIDGMTRAHVFRFPTVKRVAHLMFYIEDPINSENLSVIFKSTSIFSNLQGMRCAMAGRNLYMRFSCRLQGIHCAMAGRNLYMRFSCFIGYAMGMNMVSKGVKNVLDFLHNEFPNMDVIGVSGIS